MEGVWFVVNGGGYTTLGTSWTRTYHPLLLLPAGAELANCTETRMMYILCCTAFSFI